MRERAGGEVAHSMANNSATNNDKKALKRRSENHTAFNVINCIYIMIFVMKLNGNPAQ